jgi:hypothetical protein
MSVKKNALASALHESGARIAGAVASVIETNPPPAEIGLTKAIQPSRLGTKPITVHHPEAVRRQLKSLAGEQGRSVEDMVGEALNLLFAKYRKAEIAPTKGAHRVS